MTEEYNFREMLENLDSLLRSTYSKKEGQFYIDSLKVNDEKKFYDNYLSNILGILNTLNLICSQVVEKSNLDNSLSSQESMPDYDIGYSISELISQIFYEIDFKKIKVRDSLKEELLFSLLKYLEISIQGNRLGWYDVNKRLSSAIINIVYKNQKLMKIINQNLNEINTTSLNHNQIKFYEEFINYLIENAND